MSQIANQTLTIKVIGAKSYSFNDDKSGRLVEGVNVFYETTPEDRNQGVGIIPAKMNLPYESWDKVRNLPFPSICEPIMEQKLTTKGVKTFVTGLKHTGK